eukprot:8306478-Pyramimonas_sp.AAC.1
MWAEAVPFDSSSSSSWSSSSWSLSSLSSSSPSPLASPLFPRPVAVPLTFTSFSSSSAPATAKLSN